MLSKLRHSIQNVFITGVVIVVPVGVTIVFLRMMFIWLDGLFAPLAVRLTDRQIPGLGIISSILIIFGVGLLVTNFVGRTFVTFGETVVDKIPFVRNVYSGAKQFLATLTQEQRQAFTQVVLVEYPKRGSYALGFVTTETTGEIREKFSEDLVNVFIATTPNPTTGFLLLIPRKEVKVLPISIEDGIKIVVSGGIITPSLLASASEAPAVADGEQLHTV
jgi:uncharacterized membrane protein